MTPPDVVTVGELGPWAGALAVVWAVQTLGHLARVGSTIAAELAAIRRGLGLPAPDQVEPPPGLPFTITLSRPSQ